MVSLATDAQHDLVPGVIYQRIRTLKTQDHLHIGCRNVKPLMNEGSQSITARSLHKYKMELASLFEIRLPEFGSRKIEVP